MFSIPLVMFVRRERGREGGERGREGGERGRERGREGGREGAHYESSIDLNSGT